MIRGPPRKSLKLLALDTKERNMMNATTTSRKQSRNSTRKSKKKPRKSSNLVAVKSKLPMNALNPLLLLKPSLIAMLTPSKSAATLA